jgi:hypothetical protein
VVTRDLTVTRGKAFITADGRLNFPQDGLPCNDGTYRSVFGPSAPHDGVIYADDDVCFRLGVHKRTLGVRGSHAEDKKLRCDQARFILGHDHFTQYLLRILSERKELKEYTDIYTAAQNHHGDPHPKAALRVQTFIDMHEDGTFSSPLWLRKILVKAKKNEWAKKNKPQRGIGDLGVAASLQGFIVTAILKKAMAHSDIEFGGGHARFVAAPRTTALRQVFRDLLNPDGRFFFAFFSDDSVLSVRNADGSVSLFNIDIKSCDCSHTTYIFNTLIHISPVEIRPAIQTLVDQLRLDFEIVSAQNKSNKVRFSTSVPKLHSGSTITTIINNLACLFIMYSISEELVDDDTHATAELINRAASKCGYLVTIDTCTHPSQLQFLKHSIVYDTRGNLQPLLNLGVLLRSYGLCKGDLPGRGAIEPRARAFNGGLLQGMYPRTSFTLRDNLYQQTLPPTDAIEKHIAQMLQYKIQHDDDENFTVSDEQLFLRYRHPLEGRPLRNDEITELNEQYGKANLFTHYASPAIDKIYRQEYGIRAKYTRRLLTPIV